ncbi:MAG TPA: TraR/DksA C4-type zinc finger protein [Acidimicrobiales bacterium]|jgi:DnaK suppressor protein
MPSRAKPPSPSKAAKATPKATPKATAKATTKAGKATKAAPSKAAPKKAATTAKTSTTKKAAAPAPAKKAAVPAKNSTTKQAAPPKKAAATTTTAKAAPAAKQAKDPALDKFLQEQVALLQQERQTYTEQAEALKAEADQLAQEMEPGDIQFDEESGEGGTMNIDRERDLALSAQARAAVDEIDHALVKVGNGTYGTCENCGQPIPKARLKALPYARLCVACKSGGLSRR